MPPKAAALAPPERIVVFLRPNSCAVSVETTFETFFGWPPAQPFLRPSGLARIHHRLDEMSPGAQDSILVRRDVAAHKGDFAVRLTLGWRLHAKCHCASLR